MTNEVTNFLNTAFQSLPLQEIVNWACSIIVPVAIGFWRTYVKKHALAQTMLTAVIKGVEQASKQLGADGNTVKGAVRDASIQHGVDLAVDNFVQQTTKGK